MRKRRPTNFVRAELEGEKPIVVPFSDLHYGSPEFNKDEFLRNYQWVLDTPNVYVIGNGDWTEASTRHSVGAGIYEQIIPVQQQLEELVDLFTPLAEDGRLIAITNGNHEDRIYKESGIDITAVMANELKVPYFKNGGHFQLKVGKQNYMAYVTHGASGAQLPHTKIKKCLDLASFIEADIYMMGHVHELQAHKREFRYVDTRDGTVKKKEKYFVLTGHYLNWENGYAQMKSLIPSEQGTPKIKFHRDERLIRISL